MRVLERFALIHSGPRRLVTQPAKQALFGLITRQKEIAKTFWAVDIEETQVVKSDGWKGMVSSATLDLHQSPKAVINVTVDSSDAYTLQIMAAPRNAPQESPRVAISKNIDADPEQLAETLDDWLKEGVLDISRDLLRYTK